MAEEAEVQPTPITKKDINVRDLLEAGLHFGHQTKRWNPKMKRYIFDKRNGIHIIDLTKSIGLLSNALAFIHSIVLDGKSVLFVGTKKQAQEIVKDCAVHCGMHYVTHRWLGGTLTNNVTIRKSIDSMRSLQNRADTDNFASIPKKEASAARRELEKLSKNLSGIASMRELPGAMFVVDITREAIAVAEANKLGIPVVAIVDTNCDPDPVEYVIPGNDDALRAIKLIAEAVAVTAKDAADQYSKIAAENTRKREASREARQSADTGENKDGDSQSKPRRSPADRRRPDRKMAALSGTKAAALVPIEDDAPEAEIPAVAIAEVPAEPTAAAPAEIPAEAPVKPARRPSKKKTEVEETPAN